MIYLEALGELNIRRDGEPLPPFKSRKVTALLIYLALTPGVHTRSYLAGLLWSDLPESKALANLRFALWNITEVLGLRVFEADRLTVAWRQNPDVALDVEEFLAAFRQAQGAPSDAPATVQALERAAQLYRGDLLAGFDLPDNILFNEWLQQQRVHLHELAAEVFYHLIRHHQEQRHWAAAIAAARRLLELEPWHEEAHRLLMLALARSGQRSAALAQYTICKQILEGELGTGPSFETIRLYERLRAAESAPRHNLPASLTPFIGRVNELGELLRLLDDPHCRLLTLVGPGGVGKTRLAQQAALARTTYFLNGVVWIEFEAVDSPARLLPTIAATLGIEWRTNNLLERLEIFLRDRELLLVLDNLEHLRANAGMLVEVLRRAPEVKMLITSRERLNLHCEWVFPLDGLTFPRSDEADITMFDAVRFFEETIRRINPHFPVNSNVPALRRICQLLQGLPLALELAAALTPTISLPALAEILENNPHILATMALDVPARQRSLYAMFISAWRTLSEAEQDALRRLAVFRGGFMPAAAEYVARLSLSHLMALANKSWLRLTPNGRYEMFAITRQFVLEEVGVLADDWTRTQRAHASYFADFLAEQRAMLRLGRPEALAQVGADIENIRTAWQWAVQHSAPELLTRAAEALGHFLESRTWVQEGAETFDRVHALAIQMGGAGGALLLAWEGLFAFRLADYPRARTVLEAARALLQVEPAPAVEAFVLNNLGLVAERQGERQPARVCFEASVHSARMIGDDWALARALNNLGYLDFQEGDLTQARMVLEEALTIRRMLNDRLGIAKTLINLALVWQALCQDEPLQAALQESLSLFRESGNQLGVAICLNNLGFQAFRKQRYAEAQRSYEEALRIRREIGDPWGIAIALDNLGAVACELGEYAIARTCYAEAFSLTRSIGATYRIAELLIGVGRLAMCEGNLTRAVELLTRAMRHPAIGSEARERGKCLLSALESQMPRPEFEAAVERGNALDLEEQMGVNWNFNLY